MAFQTETVCLTCMATLKSENTFVSIFESYQNGFNISLLEMLQTLTEIRVFDEFPKSICNQCCNSLLASYEFKEKSTAVYKILCQKLLSRNDVNQPTVVGFKDAEINNIPPDQGLRPLTLNSGSVDSSLVGRISLVPARLLFEQPATSVLPTTPTISVIPIIPTTTLYPTIPTILSPPTSLIHEPPSMLEHLLTSVEEQQEVDRQEMAQQAELRLMLNTPPSLYSCFDCSASFSGEQLLIDHRTSHITPTAPAVKKETNIELAAIDIPFEVKQEAVDIDDDSTDMEMDVDSECCIYNPEVNNNAARGLQIVGVKSTDLEHEEGELTPQMLQSLNNQPSTSSTNPLECDICHKFFLEDSELQQHRLSHSNRFSCIYCQKIFIQYYNLSNHTKNKHPNLYLEFQKRTLLQGLECSIPIRPLIIPKCTTCGLIFWNENNLELHQEEHLIVQEFIEPPVPDFHANIPVANGKVDKFCAKCNTRFFRIDSYLKHMDAHKYDNGQEIVISSTVNSVFQCTFCHLTFNDEFSFKKHSQRMHKRLSISIDQELAKSNRKNYEFVEGSRTTVCCKICQKIIGYKSLPSHMALHSNIRKYGCEFCEQRFARSDYLNNHMRQIHPNELRCVQCKLQHRSKLLLDQHIQTVHGDPSNTNPNNDLNLEPTDYANVVIKPEPVSRDPSPTPQALLLEEPDNFVVASLSQACHQDSDENEDTEDMEDDISTRKGRAQSRSAGYVECPICKKTLLQQSLRNHIQFHEDSKKCEICGAEFARNDYLATHMRSTHTEKELEPFCCPICQKMCPGTLKWHLSRFHKMDENQMAAIGISPEGAATSIVMPVIKVAQSVATATGNLRCEPCNKNFQARHYYNMHMKCIHGVKGEPKESLKVIQVVEVPKIPDPTNSTESVSETSTHENGDASTSTEDICDQYQFMRGRLDVKCKICSKIIKFKYVSRHMELHMTKKKYKCDSCGEKFARSDYLSRHIRNVHLDELKCHICNHQLYRKALYYKHLLEVHQISEELANNTLLEQSDMDFHMNGDSFQDGHDEQSGDEPEAGREEPEVQSFAPATELRCIPCNRVFSAENYYNVHMKFKHSNVEVPITIKSQPQQQQVIQITTNLFCEPCNKRFSSEYYLNVHNKFKHSVIMKEEPSDKALVIFNITEVAESSKETDGHTCIFCKKNFKILYKYNAHMKIKHGVDPTSSQLTIEKSAQQTPLQNPGVMKLNFNASIDENSQPNVSSVSTYTAPSVRPLSKNKVAYECDICQITFSRRDYLDRHVKSNHTNEFDCQMCNHQLSTFHYFMLHMENDHKNFNIELLGEHECKVCHKKFVESENLVLHIANKHSGKPILNKHNCGLCGLQFGNKKLMQKHVKYKGHNNLLKLLAKRNIEVKSAEVGVRDEENESEEINFRFLPLLKENGSFECRICSKSFPQMRKTVAHTKNHKEVFIHQCSHCNYTFLEKKTRDKHFRQFHKEAASLLEKLNQTAPEHSNLNQTMSDPVQSTQFDSFVPPPPKRARMSLPNPVKTTISPSIEDLARLNILRGPKGKSQCKICGLLFNKRNEVMQHLKSHPEIPHIVCTVCGFISFGQRFLNFHMRKTHGLGPDGIAVTVDVPLKQSEEIKEAAPVEDLSPIEISAKKMMDFSLRRRTRLSVAERSRFVVVEEPTTSSQVTSKVITVPQSQVSTMTKSIPEVSQNSSEVVAKALDLSPSAVTTIDLSDSEDADSNLVATSASKSRVECKICQRRFTQIENLQNHIQYRHITDNPENKCGVCGNLLGSPSLLVEHLKIHQDNKFSCEICEKSFSLKQALLKHKEKFHSINKADKERTDNINPKSIGDMLNNSSKKEVVGMAALLTVAAAKAKKKGFKIKFYKCNFCEKHFTRKDRLITHRKIEHKKQLGKPGEEQKNTNQETDEEDFEVVDEMDVDSELVDEISNESITATDKANKILSNMSLPSSITITRISKTSKQTPETGLIKATQTTSVGTLNQNKEGHTDKVKSFACEKCKITFAQEVFLENHKQYFCYYTKQINADSSNGPSTPLV